MEINELSDDALTERLRACVSSENRSLGDVLEALAEFDARRLHEKKAHPHLFDYCTRELGYSEDAAAKRIQVARLIRKFPSVLNFIRVGKLSLTTANLLAPHMDPDNHRMLLERAKGKSKREVELLIVEFWPKEERREVVFRLPEAASHSLSAATLIAPVATGPFTPAPHLPAKIEPLTPDRLRIAFTGSGEFLEKVKRCRELLRHKYPKGQIEDILAEAVEALLDRKDPDRLKKAPGRRPPGPRSRRIPAWVRNKVWKRDKARCTYATEDGVRCPSKGFLEFDHWVPYAVGGRSDDPDNIRLLCRTHNQMAARDRFGPPPVKPRSGEDFQVGGQAGLPGAADGLVEQEFSFA